MVQEGGCSEGTPRHDNAGAPVQQGRPPKALWPEGLPSHRRHMGSTTREQRSDFKSCLNQDFVIYQKEEFEEKCGLVIILYSIIP